MHDFSVDKMFGSPIFRVLNEILLLGKALKLPLNLLRNLKNANFLNFMAENNFLII